MRCPSCGTENTANRKFCGICGHNLQQPTGGFEPTTGPVYQAGTDYGPTSAPPMFAEPPPLRRKYKALRVIAVVYKVLAFIAGLVFGLLALVSLFAGLSASSRRSGFDIGPTAVFGGLIGAFIFAFIGALWFITFYAAAEWIYVFLDIEENTRATRTLLSRRQGE